MATINQIKVGDTVYDIAASGYGYGVCSTAAEDTAKTVTINDYNLKSGIVVIKFINSAPANSTLNINNKAILAINYRGSRIVDGIIHAGDIVTLVFNGSQYDIIAIDRDNDTVYNEATTTKEGLMSAADKVTLDSLHGVDSSVKYDDMDALVIGVHGLLADKESVCKNYPYESNSALLIGNRYTSTRGRYLVLPRTANSIYSCLYKDGVLTREQLTTSTVDLSDYLPLTGGTLSGDLTLSRNANTTVKVAVPNANTANVVVECQGGPNTTLAANKNFAGLYLGYLSDWGICWDRNGNGTFKGTATGNLPLTGGTLTGALDAGGNINVKKTGTATVGCVSTDGMTCSLNATASEVGLYDNTHTKWMLYNDKNGTTIVPNVVWTQQGIRIHASAGTNGAAGYVKIAQFKINSSYQNQPIRFTVLQRGTSSDLELQFKSQNNNDPALEKFYKIGNVKAYMHKSATSTWDLYILKTENYDYIDIVDFKMGVYMEGGVVVTWTGTLASAVPDGAIEAAFKTEEMHISGNAASASQLSAGYNTLAIRGYTGTPAAADNFIFLQADYTNKVVNVGINGVGTTGVNRALYANKAGALNTARTLTIGSKGKTFDGSGNVSWSLAEIGALPLTGGTISGNLSVTGTAEISDTLTAHAGIKSGGAIRLGDGRFDFNNSQWYAFFPSNSETNYGYFHGVRENMWGHSPYANGTVALGFPNYRWGQIYSSQATISTSDRNAKKEIAPLSEKHLEFFSLLQPVSFQFIDSNSGRTHIGFISQDVENAMEACGLTSLDFAGFCKDQKEVLVTKTREEKRINEETGEEEIIEVQYDESVPVEGEYIYSLRYEEFIALNTKAIQYALEEQKKMKNEYEALRKQVEELAKKIK